MGVYDKTITQEELKVYVNDFREYLKYVWEGINLPEPTPIQIDMARTLMVGDKRMLLEAFRGVGKTYITGAYVTWRLLRNPNEKVLIVSQSGPHSEAIAQFVRRLIFDLPILEHLIPSSEMRNSVKSFDVSGCEVTVQPSVKSLGITSQLQGNRASILISDDVEGLQNSATEQMRAKLLATVAEYDAILQTTEDAQIIILGTPQSGESIYNKMRDKGFRTIVYPARFPEDVEVYKGCLADYVAIPLENGTKKPGEITDFRFTHEDLVEREASIGKSWFRLQYQLDTTLSDADKHPLKTSDIIVHDLDIKTGPISISYGSSRELLVDLPNIGFTGDSLYRASHIDKDYAPYEYSVLSIDPSGRGKDETGYAVIKQLHSKVFVADVGGISGGYTPENLVKIAQLAKEHMCNVIIIESNFGDGMFNELLKPILKSIYPCSVEEVRNNKQKELRIIDTIEPLLNQHRLVFDYSLLKRDINGAVSDHKNLSYSLVHQLTHISKDRGSLYHDDRLDALSIALGYIVNNLGLSSEEALERYKEDLLEQELEDFLRPISLWNNNKTDHSKHNNYLDSLSIN
ncbi:maturase, NTPase containing [Lauvirus lau218]|uniref:Terminase, large subunit n=1 Tax=Lauvirus lau218 TaxID=1465639 RepID=A0A060BR60_9CAUD|nr:maturase, NTPase containing [Lauvirus lau218]AIA83212.1 maturase, NTPase containing [Lauvirus lau218]